MPNSYTVGELSDRLTDLLADAFPDDVWVSGEIRDLSRSAAGHVYFQLVDCPEPPDQRGEASLSVVLFDANRRAVNAMLRRTGSVRMTDGVQVKIRAELAYYPPQSRLQLRMVGIDPFHTLGALEAERERVLRVLAADDLLERNARRPFPVVPHTIGLVTSVGSAAHADFLQELAGSGLQWRIVVADARVQGRQAEQSVVSAIQRLDRHGVGLIALVRGGGARTDLAAFDTEAIARAIAASTTPVVTGIGHEVDTSVADTVAALSFKTPTACAAALVDRANDAVRRSEVLWDSIAARARSSIDGAADRVRGMASAIATCTRRDLEEGEQRAVVAGHRLRREMGHAIARAEARIEHASVRAKALDPAVALRRGWSITRTSDGKIARLADGLGPGTELVTTLAGGEIHSHVTATGADRADQGDPDASR